jgi:dipeptidyl aminopeptidase/acylaminoacyl peptidase
MNRWAPLAASLAFLTIAAPTAQPAQTGQQQPEAQRRPRPETAVVPARAADLYVSKDPKDHPPANYQRDIDQKAADDARYAEASRGVMDFKKVAYKSSAGGMDIPAYLFQPLNKRGAKGHAAMIWVHGGVHGTWGSNMFPFVKEAVERGYVIICPE